MLRIVVDGRCLVNKTDIKRNPLLCSAGTTGMVPDEGYVSLFLPHWHRGSSYDRKWSLLLSVCILSLQQNLALSTGFLFY